jgi:RNA polymerase sigma-70 factor, ECF subfamily
MEKVILAETPLSSSTILDFDTLVNVHGRFVVNIAYAILRNSEDAEDIAQETFFRAFRSGELGKVEHMQAWLGRVAWRLAVNRFNQRSGIQKKVQMDDLLQTLPAPEMGAEDLLIKKEREALLERLLLSLPRDLRETFILLTVEEMTSRNTAEILGISESSVRDRLSRARKLLKEKLLILLEGGNGS